jgi:hypothetical protein
MSGQETSIDDLKSLIERRLNESLSSPWLSTKQAADYICSTPDTMRMWRVRGAGPRFHGKGRFIRYHRDDLDAFVRREVR